MNDNNITQLVIDLLWLVLLLSLPTVIVASVVGVMVSLVQTLTQIQDQTLQFLIKLLAVCGVIVATYHWTGDNLFNYTNMVFEQISGVRS